MLKAKINKAQPVITVKITEVFLVLRMLLKLLNVKTVSKTKQLILKSILISKLMGHQLCSRMLSSRRLFRKRILLQRLGINLYQTTWLEPRICQMVFLEEQPVETKEHRKALAL